MSSAQPETVLCESCAVRLLELQVNFQIVKEETRNNVLEVTGPYRNSLS